MTVGTLVGLVACDHSIEQILALYRYLEAEGVTQALRCAVVAG